MPALSTLPVSSFTPKAVDHLVFGSVGRIAEAQYQATMRRIWAGPDVYSHYGVAIGDQRVEADRYVTLPGTYKTVMLDPGETKVFKDPASSEAQRIEDPKLSGQAEIMALDDLQRRIVEARAVLKQLESAPDEETYLRQRSADTVKELKERMMATKRMDFDTVALLGIFGPEDMARYGSLTLPLFMSTAGGPFESLLEGALLLSYQTVDYPKPVYTRIDNLTSDHLAWKFAALEGWRIPELTQGLVTSSGMSAIMMATMAFLKSGDNFVSSNRVYGGTQQLFGVTYPKSGWNVRWVDQPWDLEQWEQRINKRTRFLYVETPSNPTLFVADIPALAELAHAHNLPLIVDSTLASAALTRPLDHGADIVLHSASKVSNGSSRAIGGAIVAKEEIVSRDEALRQDFVMQLKGGHFRNMGPCISPFNAMLIWDEMTTIRPRMQVHSENAMSIAAFLSQHPKVESVNYPGLEDHPQHEVAERLMKFPDGNNGYGYLLSFNVKGGIEAAARVAENLKIGAQVTHLGGSITVWVHNATTTHGQMSAEERAAAGVADNMIRYSAGLEGALDAIKALDDALGQV